MDNLTASEEKSWGILGSIQNLTGQGPQQLDPTLKSALL